ncbi:antitoxin Xre/MbcA/ParS toxin-binding domain-containing protein [Methylotenera sp. L2L1]|uniref:antitoxin Xre/MbcA/ParS toxin-binding domain-containing protein n=1 Tax=Methylotenera sp. L2L1 TaxID=1502770 RepID=UPI000567FFFC|nr:antitoxin Xre/MbcA/ParS toxin-binding domain-containing protein [Methylotenera sp. L2L1]
MTTKSVISPHLAEIHALAVETFGTKSKAENWLSGFHTLLNNTPIAATETASGAIEVKKILIAISHGSVV